MKNKSGKRKRLLPSQSATVDTLNDFPDEILTHILSLLPCKDAFRTTVLSKRWVSLCHSLSTLNINDEGVNNSEDWIYFRRLMDKVMLSPLAQRLTLKSLSLSCWSELWEEEADGCLSFDNWLEAAKLRGMERLYLHLLNVPLAPTIFCCKTLLRLYLTNLTTSISVGSMVHCSVDLPLLETLFVFNIFFEDTKDFTKLLLGCPKLEYLAIDRVNANAGVPEGGYFKHLSKLILACISLFNVPFKAVYNVKYLTVCEIGKSLPNKEINSFDTVFENLTKLQTLNIAKAKNSTTIEHWEYPDHVPECVSSHLTKFEVIDYEACEADFRFATYILQNARLLQVMTIHHTLHPNPMESPQFLENLSSCPRMSPTCKLNLSSS
ncbi:putative F-box domain, FBD domain, leucine-rich repeat domain, L domain-containing protein [Medicago truncatula]|uniref:F-box/RNI/FBD-like domain protein n=1 Tax=Medicago truncatula TaxID=3880 RepID=G7KCI4_MEDTR|nr:FBD-associated F-box protein At3g52670 [Medicago truncatula]AES96641.1 F-box/RNI/FBD-like domain protein [Medicago truncatula]RHN55323.1 putative F-box domain, FBD domain, leucine-rich repeat domain, L domain-containing protein [Medicago truncatula]